MNYLSDSFKKVHIVLAALIFVLLVFVQFSQGFPRGAAITFVLVALTFPNVHRFLKEIQIGQDIDDERFTLIVRKSEHMIFGITLETILGSRKLVSVAALELFFECLILPCFGFRACYKSFGTDSKFWGLEGWRMI